MVFAVRALKWVIDCLRVDWSYGVKVVSGFIVETVDFSVDRHYSRALIAAAIRW